MLCPAAEALQWAAWQARSGSWVWGLAWIPAPQPQAPSPSPEFPTMWPLSCPDLALKPPFWREAWTDGCREGKKACSYMCNEVRRGEGANNAIGEPASASQCTSTYGVCLYLSQLFTCTVTKEERRRAEWRRLEKERKRQRSGDIGQLEKTLTNRVWAN